MHTYYLLLGTNKGDRIKNLDKAIDEIEKQIGEIMNKSSIYETEPWGLEDQPDFLNMVLAVHSKYIPEKVFEITKSIESQAGTIKYVKWGPRIMDIDILYCDDMVIDSEHLNIPHKQIYTRNFTLIPLIEIAGEMIDPVKKLSLDELYDICDDDKEVFIYE
ncbi:MAG: 2-amino-4-hydroxy-6-hydroxymethyldihydropteridine diphosphokinase [Saprospiraceae bacterium]|jgi:2-amino-4-hydroxy-6-hydroxymethyldihydropteridine diphosphokinase|nr:2-amino-4-hydroxy-6-hydroxymethyldihydropteridine diphosphokinase [Saprospiraceae bacterium]MBL0027207.1 2-amino-4-hydroxy-6-hydroxymethyldihydropteridine diphosphokinase [Saprospiraceae bacterium]